MPTNAPAPDIATDNRLGKITFVSSLIGLAVLPLFPEFILQWQNGSGFRSAAATFYYQGIVAFLTLGPVLILPRLPARVWTVSLLPLLWLSTTITTFFALAQGTRWNLTAHSAMWQSNMGESIGYLSSFLSLKVILPIVAVSLLFALFAWINLRSPRPGLRVTFTLFAAGLFTSAFGLTNIIRHKGWSIRDVKVASGASIPTIGIGVTVFHPLTLMAATEFNYKTSHAYYKDQLAAQKRLATDLSGTSPIPNAAPPRLLVVVIGESANRSHFSLYGYNRPTTPYLDAMRDELFVFTDVISTGVGTLESIRSTLTNETHGVPIFPVFADAGYTTHWLSAQSNQGFDDLELGALAAACDQTVFLGNAHDGRLIPFFERAVRRPGRQLIFLNLMGSHVRYRDRYPPAEAVFHGDDEATRLRAEYDNSIRYTDKVLAALIGFLKRTNEVSCLLYFSDHGEDVYDSDPANYLFRNESLATNPMYEIPFFVWVSPQYRQGNAGFIDKILPFTTAHPHQNRALMHPLLSLARLQHPAYDGHSDPLSLQYVPRPRYVGTGKRLYAKEPVKLVTQD